MKLSYGDKQIPYKERSMIDEVLDEAEKCREKEKQDHVMKIDDTKFIFILFFVIVLVALICK